MDPQVKEQLIAEYFLVAALAEHQEPEGLFGMSQLQLGTRMQAAGLGGMVLA